MHPDELFVDLGERERVENGKRLIGGDTGSEGRVQGPREPGNPVATALEGRGNPGPDLRVRATSVAVDDHDVARKLPAKADRARKQRPGAVVAAGLRHLLVVYRLRLGLGHRGLAERIEDPGLGAVDGVDRLYGDVRLGGDADEGRRGIAVAEEEPAGSVGDPSASDLGPLLAQRRLPRRGAGVDIRHVNRVSLHYDRVALY